MKHMPNRAGRFEVRHAVRDRSGELTELELLRYQASLDMGDTQCARIFRALRAARGKWVDLPTLGEVSGSRGVGSLVSELRAMGCVIENLQQREKTRSPGAKREYFSWYRLLKEPVEPRERPLQISDGEILRMLHGPGSPDAPVINNLPVLSASEKIESDYS
jgi:hypothetical protein